MFYFFICFMIMFFYCLQGFALPNSLSQCECHGGIDTKEDYKKRLEGVHNEHEIESLCFSHPIENEHCFHGEMPWSGTIWCWHDNGYGAHDEGCEGTARSQVFGVVEAEEREVIVQEIACPDGKREEHIKGRIAHMA